jgi:cell wall-associated NlpC family hydrolase
MDDTTRALIVKRAQALIGKYKYDKKGKRSGGLPKTDDDLMDCSEFVWTVYKDVGIPGFPYLNSHAIAKSSRFEKVDSPSAGDIVYWTQGHVAIVENAGTGEFIGSQTSTGVARSNYKTNVYWKARTGRAFFRWKDTQ